MRKVSIRILAALLAALGFTAVYSCYEPEDLYGSPIIDYNDSIPQQ